MLRRIINYLFGLIPQAGDLIRHNGHIFRVTSRDENGLNMNAEKACDHFIWVTGFGEISDSPVRHRILTEQDLEKHNNQ